MTAGLQIWNAAGQLMLDATQRVGRIKGSVYIPNNGLSGSQAADLSGGTPFFSFQPDFLFMHINANSPPPQISISSTGVSWVFSGSAGSFFYPVSGWLFYGVF